MAIRNVLISYFCYIFFFFCSKLKKIVKVSGNFIWTLINNSTTLTYMNKNKLNIKDYKQTNNMIDGKQ